MISGKRAANGVTCSLTLLPPSHCLCQSLSPPVSSPSFPSNLTLLPHTSGGERRQELRKRTQQQRQCSVCSRAILSRRSNRVGDSSSRVVDRTSFTLLRQSIACTRAGQRESLSLPGGRRQVPVCGRKGANPTITLCLPSSLPLDVLSLPIRCRSSARMPS